MAEIIDAQPCVTCGAFTRSILELEVRGAAADAAGVPEGTVTQERFMCPGCQGFTVREARTDRGIFDRLIAMGASRSTANAIMIRRIRARAAGRI